MTIPNVITISRMIASPWIGSLIIGQDYDLALAACFAVGLSDFADGYIARTFHSKSILGSYLDPLSDKVFITTLYSALGYMSHIPFGVVFVVVGRDILQIGLTLAYKHKEIAQMLLHANTSMHKNAFGKQEQKRQSLKPLSLPVTTISKVNTTAQIGFALLSLLNLSPMCMEYGLQLSAYTMDVMGNMVILSTVMAGSSYVWLKSRAKQTP